MSSSEMRGMFSIGEFSRVTGMTVKTLRFYHEQKLLVPTLVDPQTGYRYYDPALIERARVIVYLRSLEFPLEEIGELLRHATDDAQIVAAIERQRSVIEERIRALRKVARSLDQFISEERQAKAMMQHNS